MVHNKFYKGEIDFNINGKPYAFSVIHNLSNIPGMTIEGALQNWLERTKVFTDKSFCKYVMSKDESFVCLTQKQYDRLNK